MKGIVRSILTILSKKMNNNNVNYLIGGSGLMNHYQKIEKCGIFGHNGSTWAQVGMEHTQQYYNEITDLVGLFTDPSDGL